MILQSPEKWEGKWAIVPSFSILRAWLRSNYKTGWEVQLCEEDDPGHGSWMTSKHLSDRPKEIEWGTLWQMLRRAFLVRNLCKDRTEAWNSLLCSGNLRYKGRKVGPDLFTLYQVLCRVLSPHNNLLRLIWSLFPFHKRGNQGSKTSNWPRAYCNQKPLEGFRFVFLNKYCYF